MWDLVHEGGGLHQPFPGPGSQRIREPVSGGIPESKRQPQHSPKIETKGVCVVSSIKDLN